MLHRKLIKFFKGKCGFFVGLIFVLIPAYLITKNLIGYDLISGGDYYELYKVETLFRRYFYSWINQTGQGWFNTLSPSLVFYYFNGLFVNLGLDKIFRFPIFFFFIFFYASFYYSIKKLVPDIKNIWQVVLSVFYVFNYVTIVIFTYPWGFTHHYIFYGFIPFLLTIFIKIIKTRSIQLNHILFFILINSIAFIGYNNVAFLFILLIVEVFVGFVWYITSLDFKLVNVIKRVLCLVLIQVLISLPYLFSFVLSNLNNIEKANSTKVYDIHLLNEATSSTFIHSFITRPVTGSEPLPIMYIYFLFPFVMLLVCYRNRKSKSESLGVVLMILLLILAALKYNSPLEDLLRFLFNFPPVAIFRSPDKIFVFYPFFYLYLIAQTIVKSKSVFLKTALICVVVFSWTFFLGDNLTKYLTDLDNSYKYAISIPSEYKNISQVTNSENITTSVLSIPYSVKNSTNWSNYPAWNFVGHDVLHLLFNRRFISANVFDHPVFETNMTFKNIWKDGNCCGDDYIEKSFDRFGVEYVIWHKDIDSGRLRENASVYEMLEKSVDKGIIRKIEDNEYFEAYKVNETKIQPLIYTENAQVTFKKINPTKYIVDIKGLKVGDRLIFKQSFNPEWKVYHINETVADCSDNHKYVARESVECVHLSDDFVFSDVGYIFNKPLNLDHTMVDEYANSWVVDEPSMGILRNMDGTTVNDDGSVNTSLVIYFRPQSFLIIQYLMIAFTIAVPTIVLIFISRKKSKELII